LSVCCCCGDRQSQYRTRTGFLHYVFVTLCQVPHTHWHSTNNSLDSAAETVALYDHMILAVSSSAIECMLPYEVQWDLDSLDYSVIVKPAPRLI
jgi:hypothetical protein